MQSIVFKDSIYRSYFWLGFFLNLSNFWGIFFSFHSITFFGSIFCHKQMMGKKRYGFGCSKKCRRLRHQYNFEGFSSLGGVGLGS